MSVTRPTMLAGPIGRQGIAEATRWSGGGEEETSAEKRWATAVPGARRTASATPHGDAKRSERMNRRAYVGDDPPAGWSGSRPSARHLGMEPVGDIA